MKKIFTVLLLFPVVLMAQQQYTLSGSITDAETGEDLIGVTVVAADLGRGAITNSYGFYSLTLAEGLHNIQFSYLGYETITRSLNFNKNQSINLELSPSSIALNEVTISSERRDKNITSAEMGIEKINLKQISVIPVLLGEKDVLKTIQLLPGISSSGEGSTGFNVRGGSMDQNLILLDEAPLYSSSHLLGFFSVFNADALKEVTVYKGGIPAYYGGRASSVLDISMNNGNSKRLSVTGGTGLISTRLTVEAPIVKDKMSFIVSGRRTYADWVAKAIFSEERVPNELRLYFFDLNAKINYSINDKNRLFLSGYFGSDVFGYSDQIGTDWGNSTGTLRWNHLFSDKLFSNTSLIYSNYNYGFNIGFDDISIRLTSGIQNHSFKEDFTWFLNPKNTIKFGGGITYHEFMPGELTSDGELDFEIIMDMKRALESSLYLQNEHKISERFSANYGLRLSMFNQIGPGWIYEYGEDNIPSDSSYFESDEIVQSYYGFEPRFSVNYILGNRSSVKVSYNRMAQYLHLLSNSTSGNPTDVWMPSSNNLKPLYVDQLAIGYFRNFLDNTIETSVEVYYKNIQNAADYEDGANIFLNEFAEATILTGMGRSYGLELYVKKKYGDFSGWISYTLSRTENKIEGVNDFDWYPVKYDKTHDVSVVATYQFIPRLSLSAVWVYTTGNAVTFPSGRYVIDGLLVPYYTERNGYRMPHYHRMDVSINFKGKKRKRFESNWDFSVYNVYNRHNAYLIDFRESETVPGATEAVKLSLFGIVPSVSYNFKF
ncbi:carboxypeptidase-like regulatory domain-containing protein [Bacteroidota bacterium]